MVNNFLDWVKRMLQKIKKIIFSAQAKTEKVISQIKENSEIVEKTKDIFDAKILETITESHPWIKTSIEILGINFSIVRALAEIYKKATESSHPHELCHFACIAAFLKCMADAIYNDKPAQEMFVHKSSKEKEKIFGNKLSDLIKIEFLEYSNFHRGNMLGHEFFKLAKGAAEEGCDEIGYNRHQKTRILDHLQDKFEANFDLILSDGNTRENFAPLTDWLASGGGKGSDAIAALFTHAKYQRQLYRETRLFKAEPFALEDVYIDPNCKVITTSSEMQKPLTDTVLGFIKDPNFDQPIVIQGVAGSGKTSFTLHLCRKLMLMAEEFRPIRIQVKHMLNLSDPQLVKVLAASIRLGEDDDPKVPSLPDIDLEKFLKTHKISIKEKEDGETSKDICKYVLILDGWDEVSLSRNQSFREGIEKILEGVKTEFFQKKNIYRLPIRVILTGRPSDVISESRKFLDDETPILTIAPMDTAKFNEYIDKLAEKLKNPSLKTSEGWKSWSIPNPEFFKELFRNYEILNLPLLAFLAIKTIASIEKSPDKWEEVAKEMVKDKTSLYRSLIDTTCGNFGNPTGKDIKHKGEVTRNNLRPLLHLTAAAITVGGSEDISSYEVLKERLNNIKDLYGKGQPDEESIDEVISKDGLSSLIVCYYFKGGYNNLGCEFTHKSFREYLFAECLVETLKAFVKNVKRKLPTYDEEKYWEDFSGKDPHYKFSRNLAKLLAPQWLTPEVIQYLEALLSWEIKRAVNDDKEDFENSTEKLTIDKWKQIRDGLANLWGWWARGVHLRGKATLEDDDKTLKFETPYVYELMQWDTRVSRDSDQTIPVCMTSTIDGRLGDGLFRLCAVVHSEIANAEGWLKEDNQLESRKDGRLFFEDMVPKGDPLNPLNPWINAKALSPKPYKYQVEVTKGEQTWILFAPSGDSPKSFRSYCFRINSAVSRPGGEFPAKCSFNSVFLNEVKLAHFDFANADLKGSSFDGATFSYANLNNANLNYANLHRAKLDYANLHGAFLDHANLHDAGLHHANFYGATLHQANLNGAKLDNANLNLAKLDNANLNGADLNNANLNNADLNNANLDGANLSCANLNGANLYRANLYRATLNYATLNYAILNYAILDSATLNGATLNGANLDRANLEGANLKGANLGAEQLLSAFINEDTQVPPGLEAVKLQRLQKLKNEQET
jgi:uncharacterized protein YjbI with pentapeptide repeats